MEQDNRKEIIAAAQDRLKNLKDNSAKKREWYQNLRIRIADRQSEHISLVSSLSAAIVALTISFPTKNLWTELSFWFLVTTTLLGTVLVLLLISLDKKMLDHDYKFEMPIWDNLKASTEDVISNPENYTKHVEDFKREIKKIELLPEKYDCQRQVLGYLYVVVLATFVLGVMSLIGAWVTRS